MTGKAAIVLMIVALAVLATNASVNIARRSGAESPVPLASPHPAVDWSLHDVLDANVTLGVNGNCQTWQSAAVDTWGASVLVAQVLTPDPSQAAYCQIQTRVASDFVASPQPFRTGTMHAYADQPQDPVREAAIGVEARLLCTACSPVTLTDAAILVKR